MTQQQSKGDLNGDSDNDIKYSNMTLQHNQLFHAEKSIQYNKNNSSISFPNDKMNGVDEQGKTKLQHNNVKKNYEKEM